MFIISDIKLLDSFKDATLYLHSKTETKVYSELVPFSLKYDTILDHQLPVLVASVAQSQMNHIRLNIRNRNIEALVVVTDEASDIWIEEFYNQGISLILVNSNENNIMSQMITDIQNYKQRTYKRISTMQETLQNYTNTSMSYTDILTHLKKDSGFDAVVANSKNEIIASTLGKQYILTSIKPKHQLMRIKNTITIFEADISLDRNEPTQCLWIRIPTLEQDYFQLLILNAYTFQYADALVFEAISNAIRLETLQRIALESSETKQMNEVFDDLLNGKHSSYEELVNNAHTLGLDESKTYRILTIGFLDTEDSLLISETVRFKPALDLTIQKLESIWPQFFFRQYSNRITLLVDDTLETDRMFKEMLKPQILDIVAHLKHDQIRLKIGVSDKTDIRDIHLKSIQSLQVIKITQLLKSEESIIFFDNLGIYKLFIKLQSSYKLHDIIPQVIFDIESFNAEYLETLIVFLEQNQNYSETARMMFIHPKTVRYRIKKLVEDFNLNLDLPEVVMNLQMGFRAYDLEKSNIIL